MPCLSEEGKVNPDHAGPYTVSFLGTRPRLGGWRCNVIDLGGLGKSSSGNG